MRLAKNAWVAAPFIYIPNWSKGLSYAGGGGGVDSPHAGARQGRSAHGRVYGLAYPHSENTYRGTASRAHITLLRNGFTSWAPVSITTILYFYRDIVVIIMF
jgi:hypothetical protein